MAKSKELQWIPSGGVLAVAGGAAVVAAILVNIYIAYVKSEYELGSEVFLMLKEDVDANTILQDKHLQQVRVPKPLLPAFKRAIPLKDKDSQALKQRVTRHISAGEFLWYRDLLGEDPSLLYRVKILPGYELVTIPINPATAPGSMLQPGEYVNVRGDFNTSSDPKIPRVQIIDVVLNVQVKAIDGSPEPVAKNRSYGTIGFLVKGTTQARQLDQIGSLLVSKKYTVTLAPNVGVPNTEPVITKEAMALLESRAPVAP